MLKSHLAESVLSGSRFSCGTNYVQSNAIREICNEPANEICSKVNDLECFNTYGIQWTTPYTPPPPIPAPPPVTFSHLTHNLATRQFFFVVFLAHLHPRAVFRNVSYRDVICIQIFPERTPSAARTLCTAAVQLLLRLGGGGGSSHAGVNPLSVSSPVPFYYRLTE